MRIGEKLELLRETERRNAERWSITSAQQEDRQTAVEYSEREALMSLYVR